MGYIGSKVLQRLDLEPVDLTAAPPEPETAPEPVGTEPVPAR